MNAAPHRAAHGGKRQTQSKTTKIHGVTQVLEIQGA